KMLHRLGNRGLQRMSDYWKRDSRHLCSHAGVSGGAIEYVSSRDPASCGPHADDGAVFDVDRGDLGFLMNMNAGGIHRSRVAPVDRIVANDSAGCMIERAEDRIPYLGGDIEVRNEPLDLWRPDHFRTDTLELVDLGAPSHRPQRRIGMRQS